MNTMAHMTREAEAIGLPPGHTLRSPTLDDVPAVVALCRATELRTAGRAWRTEALLRHQWANPELTVEHDLRLVHDAAGALVGYFGVVRMGQGNHPILFGYTHPGAKGRAIGAAALRWGERRAREFMEPLPADLRLAIHAVSQSDFAPRVALLEGFGMRPVRTFRILFIEFDGSAIPAPAWPEGIELRPFDRKRDALALYRATDEAFADHWGHEPATSEEEGFAKWSHKLFGSEYYDPALMFVAWAGDEIAGFSLCQTQDSENLEYGYVVQLGVRRPWRKRGLATALLYHTFGEFERRGRSGVSLGVDSENLTGATRLYERVGMRILREFVTYEKELRPSREIALR